LSPDDRTQVVPVLLTTNPWRAAHVSYVRESCASLTVLWAVS